MARKTIKTAPQKTGAKKNVSPVVDAQAGYVRTEAAPLLPPPPSEVGITGWLYKNIFASMSDFGSIGGPKAAAKSSRNSRQMRSKFNRRIGLDITEIHQEFRARLGPKFTLDFSEIEPNYVLEFRPHLTGFGLDLGRENGR